MTVATARPPVRAPYQGRSPVLRGLRRTRILLVIGALLFGALGVWTVQVRTDGANDAKSHSGPLTQQAEKLYHALSDADATAGTMYLHVGEPPKLLLGRYEGDLVTAQTALVDATSEAGASGKAKDALSAIAAQLPEYIEDNKAAAANNLLGYPVGIRYLNMASNLMQTKILPQAQALTDAEAQSLSDAEDTADSLSFAWILALALLAWFVVVQVRESRRTHRMFNLGLLAASLLLLLSAGWLEVAVSLQEVHTADAKKQGSNQISALATARILSLQARSDEMLTLVGRGTADAKEADFAGVVEPRLAQELNHAVAIATDGQGTDAATKAVQDEQAWLAAHQALRNDDKNNLYQHAVDSALGEGDFAKAGAPTSANSAFQALQDDLDKAIKHAEDSFDTQSAKAANASTGLEIGVGVLALAVAGAAVAGLGRRIAEYQ